MSLAPSLSALLINQRERWQRGDCVSVEKLVEEQPSLREQAEPVLELLYHEMLLREEQGQPPQLDDYLVRFPQFANELRMQFEVHAALTAVGGFGEDDDAVRRAAQAFDSAPRCPEIEGYELMGEIGRGGMGVVYKARQVKLNRIVALKMIRTGLLAGSHELARFRREAEVVAQLQHPHIVQIHEVGEARGWPYLALEFVDGTSLDKVLGGKPQPIEAAARLIETLARAMHYAHLRGVVHRDLKPANVLLGSATTARDSSEKSPSSGPKGQGSGPKSPSSGAKSQEQTRKASATPTLDASPLSPDFAKITDFGLAKSLEPEADGPTHTGDVLGTPSYMAPEQAGGKPSDVNFAADIYSLGAILYEMLTGRPPFVAETMVETLLLVRTQEPSSPSRLRPNLPRDLVTICLTCLQKQPWRRYGTALELADDLRHFLQHEPIHARPIGLVERSVKWARRRPAAATLIATVLLVSVFGFIFVTWQLGQTAAALNDARKAHAETRAQNYLNSVALAHHELLAHHVNQAEQLLEECPLTQRGWEWYYLKRLCRADLLTLPGHSSEVRALAYSKDGRFIASGSGSWFAGPLDGEVKLWDAQTGKELYTLERNTKTIFALAFSPDSQLLASAGATGKITLWNPRTGQRVRELEGHASNVLDLAFSPDSKRLVSTAIEVRIWDVETGELLRAFRKHSSSVFGAAWSPDGRLIATGDWKGEIHLWDPEKLQHMRLLAHVLDVRACSFSPDSTMLAAGGWDGAIQIWDLHHPDAPPTLRHPNAGQIYDLAFSPEGRRIAFCARDGVKVWDWKSGVEQHDFAGHNGVTPSLAFSPDGTRLATGGVDGSVKVWDATVREEFRRAVEVNAALRGFADGPDGRLLALGSVGSAVKAWDAITTKTIHSIPNQSTPVTAIAGDWNGHRLAWVGTNNMLCVWDRTTEKITWQHQIGSGPVSGLAFSPSGTQLGWGGADGIVQLYEPSTGQPLFALGTPGNPLTGVAFHPEGKLLATIDEEGAFRIWDLASRSVVAQFGSSRRHLPTNSESEQDVQSQAAPRMARLCYSPDGRRLVSTTRLRPPEIWDAITGRLALILDRAVDGADTAAFTADGRQLFAGLGAQVRVWNTTDQDRQERLRLAQEHALAWHRRWFQTSRNERNWPACAFHLRHLIEAEPTNSSHHEQLANTLGYLGQWQEALAENNKAIELGSKSEIAWNNRAVLALHFDDQNTYREACASAHDLFPAHDNVENANFLAWISSISPSAGGDPLRQIELAEWTLDQRPGTYNYLNTLGAALYRAGRYTDAIDQLQAAIRAHERKQGLGQDWAFLAMAYAQVGDSENARFWLEKTLTASDDLPQWQMRVELRVLQREAAEVVNRLAPPSPLQ